MLLKALTSSAKLDWSATIATDLKITHVPANTSLRSTLVLSIFTYLFNLCFLAIFNLLGHFMLHLVDEAPYQTSAQAELFVHLFLLAPTAPGGAATTRVLRRHLMLLLKVCRGRGASVGNARETLWIERCIIWFCVFHTVFCLKD